MHGHLVAVKVGVVGRADQGVQLDGLAFHQQRLKGLDAEAVQGGGAVEHDRVFAHHFFQNVPDHQFLALDHLFGAFDGGGQAAFFELGVDKGLEQLERHLFGQAALVQFQFGTDHDNGTAGIVHAFAEQVLAEAALFALDHVGQGLERTAVCAGNGPAAPAVVEQRVHGFLKHALFVADDDVGRAQFHQAFQAVVPVDDAAVEVVQVRGGETAAVQGNQGAQFGRDNRNHFHDHPLRFVAGLEEGFNDLQTLGQFFLLGLGAGGLGFLAQGGAQFLQIQLFQERAHGLGAHAHGQGVFAVMIKDLQVLIFRNDLQLAQVGVARIQHDVGVEIEDLFQVRHGDVEQGADFGRQGLEKPDVGHGRGQFDVAHALAPHFGGDDFNAALFADNAAVLHALVFAAVALVVFDRPEDLGAEQAVALGFESPVVDGFRLFHFAVGPLADGLGGGNGNLNGFQVFYIGNSGGGTSDGKEIVQSHNSTCRLV